MTPDQAAWVRRHVLTPTAPNSHPVQVAGGPCARRCTGAAGCRATTTRPYPCGWRCPDHTWIVADAADPQEVAEVVHAIFSGAPLRQCVMAGGLAVYPEPAKG